MAETIDVDGTRAPAFALAETLAAFASGWHAHRKHQILYAASGTLRLQAGDRQWLLPPQRAAWIAARVAHRVEAEAASLRTLYLDPELLPAGAAAPAGCRVFPVTPLLRELILHGMKWGPGRDPEDEAATRFFVVCAELCAEQARADLPLWLPAAKSPELERAIAFTLAHLDDDVSPAAVARAAGVSARTLARRFPEETQMTWQRFLHAARLLRAMELLCLPGARVGTTAHAVGFASVAAFVRAFERFTGESPKEYRERMAQG